MGVTLFAPPYPDPSKSQIENLLDLTPVTDVGPVSVKIHPPHCNRVTELQHSFNCVFHHRCRWTLLIDGKPVRMFSLTPVLPGTPQEHAGSMAVPQ
jgi:hypothetical protein